MAIILRPTTQKCPDCGSFLDVAEGLKACPHCGAGPLCPTCEDAHRDVRRETITLHDFQAACVRLIENGCEENRMDYYAACERLAKDGGA